ncbi:hypothetical protein E2C01_039810 [Portunus trituberculatus]|uniref:Uncharacterized protein n=1 Tax=Portunus trituberculatus TaxID=210409 RepID=A0A5B7FFQ9_PORTR|nr:hypothetical protein [Portunus trituberculatus]
MKELNLCKERRISEYKSHRKKNLTFFPESVVSVSDKFFFPNHETQMAIVG